MTRFLVFDFVRTSFSDIGIIFMRSYLRLKRAEQICDMGTPETAVVSEALSRSADLLLENR